MQSPCSAFVAVGGLTGSSGGRTGASGRTAMGLAVGPALRLYRDKQRFAFSREDAILVCSSVLLGGRTGPCGGRTDWSGRTGNLLAVGPIASATASFLAVGS